jgi:two-component system sensor histidine kinase VanS
MVVIPATYKTKLSDQFIVDFKNLLSELAVVTIEDAAEDIDTFCISNNASITIRDMDGNEAGVYPHKYHAKLVGENNFLSENETEFTKVNVNGSAVFKDSQQEYIVLASATLSPVNETADMLFRLLPMIAIIIFGISFTGAFLFSRQLSRPIVSISKIAKKMAALDMTWHCDERRVDEIGELSACLNEMAVNLDAALKNLQASNAALTADIERERRQEQRRRDFFAAVSHELKTPITILKGELEGMIENIGMYKDREKFLRHAFGTTESIESLVGEILSISKMEAQNFSLRLSKRDIGALLSDCCKEYEALASEKEICLHCEIESNTYFNVDMKLFRKAISNIINNAISHSPHGADIFVSLWCNDTCGVLAVENTGIKIDENDFDSLYEPFYRVDKSRNRQTGGSGLGLYIVKAVFDLHNMDCKIENTAKGVKFTAMLKLE